MENLVLTVSAYILDGHSKSSDISGKINEIEKIGYKVSSHIIEDESKFYATHIVTFIKN